ncbi:MAG: multicopper oxidase family protein [Mycobacterium sp.]
MPLVRGKQLTVLAAIALLVSATAGAAFGVGPKKAPQVPLDSHLIDQFAQALPMLDIAGGTIQTVDGTQPSTILMCEFAAAVLPPGTIGSGPKKTATTVWGYYAGNHCPTSRDTFTGPVVLAKRGTPTAIEYVNRLGVTQSSNLLAYTNSVDKTMRWADPLNGAMNACDSNEPPEPGSECAQNYKGPIPAVVHLHGGEVPPEVDGEPDSWFTMNGLHGPTFYTAAGASGHGDQLTYPNTQEAAPIWFHDHTMGATRLNVYAGLAGAYLIADDGQSLPDGLAGYGLTNNGQLEPTIPLVIQDRMFDTNGQLYFPAGTSGGTVNSPNPEHPYWVPEFIGDTILVNGKAWPFLNVEPKRYRFLFLNGSNARPYSMSLVDPVSGNPGPALWVIATDGGYLESAAVIDDSALVPDRLTMMPGERYEVIVDFAGFEGGVSGPNGQPYSGNWLLSNTANAPFPSGDEVDPTTTGRIMLFKVGPCGAGLAAGCAADDSSFDPASDQQIRTDGNEIVRLVDPVAGDLAAGVAPTKIRQLTLNEIVREEPITAINPATGELTDYPGGPLEVVLNNSPYDGGGDMTTSTCKRSDFRAVGINGLTLCVSEQPTEGDTEEWQIVNLTMDAHPIHMHLVQFQLMNRQAFDLDAYTAAYETAFPSGSFQPEFGPPLDISPSPASGGTYGGNPDVTPYLTAAPFAPTPAEAGWKDTVIALPGQVTRFVVRFAPTDLPIDAPAASLAYPFDPSGAGARGYVWHCHIVDHEDNEMMRPWDVLLNPAAPPAADRPLVVGRDY